jgi:hypothetical protein
MKKYSKNLPKSHPVSGFPLFDWKVEVVPATRAGIHLPRRYRVDPSIADVVANLAGLGQGREAI